jgi:hypothetical protein
VTHGMHESAYLSVHADKKRPDQLVGRISGIFTELYFRGGAISSNSVD